MSNEWDDNIASYLDAPDYGKTRFYIENVLPMYSMRDGDNFVDIIQKKELVWPTLRCGVHYNIGVDKGSVLCNVFMQKDKCCICEEKSKFELDDEGKLPPEANHLRTSLRFLIKVIDAFDEKSIAKGPQLFDAAMSVDKGARGLSRDPRTRKIINIAHSSQGYTFYFKKEGKGLNTDYSGFRTVEREYKIKDEWINTPQLEEFLFHRSYKQVKTLFLGTDFDDEDSSTSREPKSPINTPSSEVNKEEERVVEEERVPGKSMDERLKDIDFEGKAEDRELPGDDEELPF